MVICIAGMHRSGTSMVAGVLAAAGVYLGEESDFLEAREGENADGFREHFGFYALNERLLEHLGAGWDAPRMGENWEARGDLEPFREEAVLLADRMGRSAGPGGHWGWKDPRNSITIPFWRSLLPDAKVVVCVRDPADVAASLRKRNNLSRAAAGRLWLAYYESLLAHVPESRRVVTHYETYFENFDREVERLCAGLGIPLDETKRARARACVKPALRHNREAGLSAGEFPPGVAEMYERLLNETASGSVREPPAAAGAPDIERAKFHAETARREEHIRMLANENRLLRDSLARLERRLVALGGRVADLESDDIARARALSKNLQAAREAIGAVSQSHAGWLALQDELEKTLRDKDSFLPGWIRRWKPLNSLNSQLRRIRKTGKLIAVQGGINAATAACLDRLAGLAEPMARPGPSADAIPPGLEKNSPDLTHVDAHALAGLIASRIP